MTVIGEQGRGKPLRSRPLHQPRQHSSTPALEQAVQRASEAAIVLLTVLIFVFQVASGVHGPSVSVGQPTVMLHDAGTVQCAR